MNNSKLCLIMPSINQALKKDALASLENNTKVPFDVYQPPKGNHGWIKGNNLGIEASKDFEYIVLANDDILAPNICDWAQTMIDTMEQKKDIGALGPLTMNAMGYATLNVNNCTAKTVSEVPFVSFFFVMLRNEAIKKTGLLDQDLPGGDDLDYCLRLKEAGYKIAITPKVFIWHHYAQTGKKLYPNYWDSAEHAEKINHALIRKHGFKKYIYNQVLDGIRWAATDSFGIKRLVIGGKE